MGCCHSSSTLKVQPEDITVAAVMQSAGNPAHPLHEIYEKFVNWCRDSFNLDSLNCLRSILNYQRVVKEKSGTDELKSLHMELSSMLFEQFFTRSSDQGVNLKADLVEELNTSRPTLVEFGQCLSKVHDEILRLLTLNAKTFIDKMQADLKNKGRAWKPHSQKTTTTTHVHGRHEVRSPGT
jgi:hypothetical protein